MTLIVPLGFVQLIVSSLDFLSSKHCQSCICETKPNSVLVFLIVNGSQLGVSI